MIGRGLFFAQIWVPEGRTQGSSPSRPILLASPDDAQSRVAAQPMPGRKIGRGFFRALGMPVASANRPARRTRGLAGPMAARRESMALPARTDGASSLALIFVPPRPPMPFRAWWARGPAD
jgi:hypothetical protein